MATAQSEKMDRRKRSPVDQFRTWAWYEACVRATSANTPTMLERMFKHTGEGRKRLWERYRKIGMPLPSVERNGRPGIVAIVGERFAKTRIVFEHPLWIALDPRRMPDVQEVNELLSRMDEWVVSTFLVNVGVGETPKRDWFYLEDVAGWDYPWMEIDLEMDLLAAHLLIFREATVHGQIEVADSAARKVRVLLHESQDSYELCKFAEKLTKFVIDNFLGPKYAELDLCIPHKRAAYEGE